MKVSKKKALHDLQLVSIPPTPEVKAVKRDDGSVYHYVESVAPFTTHPTVSNEEVTNKFNVNDYTREQLKYFKTEWLDWLLREPYYSGLREGISIIKQALTTPKISDSEVEELFDIVKDWTYQDNSNTRYVTKYSVEDRLKRKKTLNELKTKFQQMQQEIARLKEDNFVLRIQVKERRINFLENIFRKDKDKLNKISEEEVKALQENVQFRYEKLCAISSYVRKRLTYALPKELDILNDLDEILVNDNHKLKSIGGNK